MFTHGNHPHFVFKTVLYRYFKKFENSSVVIVSLSAIQSNTSQTKTWFFDILKVSLRLRLFLMAKIYYFSCRLQHNNQILHADILKMYMFISNMNNKRDPI